MIKSKYNAKKIKIGPYDFDSVTEGRYYSEVILTNLNLIKSFRVHPTYQLQEPFRKYDKSFKAITLEADFEVIYNDGRKIVIDIKGQALPLALVKKKLFDYKYPETKLQWLCMSKMDGGWISFDMLKAARKIRKAIKKKAQVLKK